MVGFWALGFAFCAFVVAAACVHVFIVVTEECHMNLLEATAADLQLLRGSSKVVHCPKSSDLPPVHQQFAEIDRCAERAAARSRHFAFFLMSRQGPG